MRIYVFIITLFVSLCLNSCIFLQNDEKVAQEIKATSLCDVGSTHYILEESAHYKIIQKDQLYYCYFLNKNGDTIKADGPFPKMPRVFSVDGRLVRFTFQAGTGIGTQYGYYYDVQTEMFSEKFQGVFDQYDNKVVYLNFGKVIVRDIFDVTKYYKEYATFKNVFSKVAEPIVNVSFSRDGKYIIVKYLTGDDYREVSESFEI